MEYEVLYRYRGGHRHHHREGAPVSYTHLDVYKRQGIMSSIGTVYRILLAINRVRLSTCHGDDNRLVGKA